MSKPQYERNDKDRRYEFFQAAGFTRRKIKLDKPPTLQSNAKGTDRKIVFHVRMALTGQSLIGFPSFLQIPYESLEREGSLVRHSTLDDFQLDNMDMEFFSVESGGKRFTRLVNKTLYDFAMVREEDEDSFLTVLRFKFRVKQTFGSFALWEKHGKQDIYVEFIPNSSAIQKSSETQMSLGEQPDEGEEAPPDVSDYSESETEGFGAPGNDDEQDEESEGEDLPTPEPQDPDAGRSRGQHVC